MPYETCPHCGARVRADRLSNHVEKVHTHPRPKVKRAKKRGGGSLPFIPDSSPPSRGWDDYEKFGHWW